jgi:hypothetical protein
VETHTHVHTANGGDAAAAGGGIAAGQGSENAEAGGGAVGWEEGSRLGRVVGGQERERVEAGGWAVRAGHKCKFSESLEGKECGGLMRFTSTSLRECEALCCQHVPCNLWQWVSSSSSSSSASSSASPPPSPAVSEGRGLEDGSAQGACWMGLGSLDFPCFPVSVGDSGSIGRGQALSYHGMRRKVL